MCIYIYIPMYSIMARANMFDMPWLPKRSVSGCWCELGRTISRADPKKLTTYYSGWPDQTSLDIVHLWSAALVSVAVLAYFVSLGRGGWVIECTCRPQSQGLSGGEVDGGWQSSVLSQIVEIGSVNVKKQESAQCIVSLNLYELVTFWCLESESSASHAWLGQEQAERFTPLHPAEATSLLWIMVQTNVNWSITFASSFTWNAWSCLL